MNGNFDFAFWAVFGSQVHTQPKKGLCELVNFKTRQGAKTNLFCHGCFWAVLACFGLVNDEYMNIYKGYRNVTSVFAL